MDRGHNNTLVMLSVVNYIDSVSPDSYLPDILSTRPTGQLYSYHAPRISYCGKHEVSSYSALYGSFVVISDERGKSHSVWYKLLGYEAILPLCCCRYVVDFI